MLNTATVTSFQLQRHEGDLSQEGGRHLDNAATVQAADHDRERLEVRTSALALDLLVVPTRTGSVEDARPYKLSLPLLVN